MWFKKKEIKTERAPATPAEFLLGVDDSPKEELGDIAKHIISLFEKGNVNNEFRIAGPYNLTFKFNNLTIVFDDLSAKPKFFNHNGVHILFTIQAWQ